MTKHLKITTHVLDALMTPPVRWVARMRIPPPVMLLLGAARTEALRRVLKRARAEATPLFEALGNGDPEAEVTLDALVERSLAALGEETRQAIRRGGWPRRLREACFWLDQRFHACDRQELMDDPDLEPHLGQRLVVRLDQLNQTLGSYEAFFRAALPFLEAGRSGYPTRVLELAAGAGGFSLWMAREARQRGLALEVVATDLREDYFALGRERAAKEGLDIRFEALDALSMADDAEEVDVVICVQALHHFPPGKLALLFHRAAERARRAVVLVDGCRSALLATAFLGLATLRFADPAYLHDAWVSFRRFYLAQELALICGLGPHGSGVTVSHVAPGHCVVVGA